MFSEYYPDGSSPLSERHLVFGVEGNGAPLIWDSNSNSVHTFWFGDGDWQDLSPSFEQFIEALLPPPNDSEQGGAPDA